MICENCFNGFTVPKPILPDYSKEDFQAREGDREKLTQLTELPIEIIDSYSKQLLLISQNLPKESKVLEIGGGEGIFLELVQSGGFQVELIEPSRYAATRAVKRGLKVKNTYLDQFDSSDKYDLICMGHVLEHMDNPINQIRKLRDMLNPNGYLMLTQTNFKGFMPLLLKENWYAWVPQEHFTHFSLKGLKYIAKETSFQLIDYKYSRLVHRDSLYHRALRYVSFLQDQIHVLLRMQ